MNKFLNMSAVGSAHARKLEVFHNLTFLRLCSKNRLKNMLKHIVKTSTCVGRFLVIIFVKNPPSNLLKSFVVTFLTTFVILSICNFSFIYVFIYCFWNLKLNSFFRGSKMFIQQFLMCNKDIIWVINIGTKSHYSKGFVPKK